MFCFFGGGINIIIIIISLNDTKQRPQIDKSVLVVSSVLHSTIFSSIEQNSVDNVGCRSDEALGLLLAISVAHSIYHNVVCNTLCTLVLVLSTYQYIHVPIPIYVLPKKPDKL